jgi:hypothetical protein
VVYLVPKMQIGFLKRHFRLGTTSFTSWQTTIWVFVAAWKVLHKFKKSNRKQKELFAKFKKSMDTRRFIL